jgi:hypothetical protein
MEIVEEYDKLCQRIHELRIQFYREYGIKPNNVNVGHEGMYILKNGNRFLVENGTKDNDEGYTIFGMKLKHITEDNYVSVGFVIE